MNQFQSGAALKAYYTAELKLRDYYTQQVAELPPWRGKAAALLGLGEHVTDAEFDRLADNLHPQTGEPITPRTREDRTSGYDLNFHVPKGISVLHALGGDERIPAALKEAVQETMQEIERQAQTRVRLDGKHENRVTGNLVWGEFLDATARPVDGIPDPHLHVHCIVFNVTHDPVENRFKAAQFREIKQDMPYYEAAFYSRLARKLEAIGYEVERTAKGWDLAGMSDSLTRKFSRRTLEIEEEALRRNITDPIRKAELGAKTRKSKLKDLQPEELREQWLSRLDPGERDQLSRVADGKVRSRDRMVTAKEAIDHAIEDRFTRVSVVPYPRLLETALRFGLGDVTPEQIHQEAAKHPELISGVLDGERLVTTQSALREEEAMLAYARDGKNMCVALQGEQEWKAVPGSQLNQHQRTAIRHVLTSQDRVTLIRGGAGTGKTTLMKEAVAAIERRGKKVVVVAPTGEASRDVLRKSGFREADTLHRLLTDKEYQNQAKGGVLWCDEAGLVGTPDMKKLFDLAAKLDARVVLSGDTRQHTPVQRGDALRLLETRINLKPAEVLQVVRQQDRYREAVEAISRGEYDVGIRTLDEMGAIREIRDSSRLTQIATDYVEAVRSGRTCLVVAPTHAEGNEITAMIRAELKRAGTLQQEERTFLQRRDMGWSDGQKGDAALYERGQLVRFYRSVRGFKAGEVVRVIDRDRSGRVLVEPVNQRRNAKTPPRHLPLNHASRFGVFQENVLPLATGERIRFTGGGYTKDRKHRLNSGATYRLAGWTKEGHLKLENGWVVDRSFGHITHGYTTTSVAAQGKGEHLVLVSQSWASLGAASINQFYVSLSRGKQEVRFYTDDRQALIEAMEKLSERRSASELVGSTSGDTDTSVSERRKQHWMAMQRLRSYEESREQILSGLRRRESHRREQRQQQQRSQHRQRSERGYGYER